MKKLALMIILLLTFILIPSSAMIAMAEPAPDIKPLPGQVNPYKTRYELLMDATNYVGVIAPEQAATIWASGLSARSAAKQYVVMTKKLKKEYAEQLDAYGSNWVTGQSSPSIQNFTIEKVVKIDDTHTEIDLKFEEGYVYENSSKYYDAKLWTVREGEFWRIERIWTDEGLFTYTWYKP